MKIRAKRGVCIGVGNHMVVDQIADVDPATAQFLVSTGAVELVKDEPAAPAPAEVQPEVKPAKAGKSKEK